MIRDYRKYQPISTEDLPARYAGIFHMLELTFTPANDTTIVTTITGQNLQLICQAAKKTNARRRRSSQPATRKPSGNSAKAIYATARHKQALATRRRHERPRRRTIAAQQLASRQNHRRRISHWCHGQQQGTQSALCCDHSARGETKPMVDQVERGVRCDPCVWVRRDGHVVCLTDMPDIAVTQNCPARRHGQSGVA